MCRRFPRHLIIGNKIAETLSTLLVLVLASRALALFDLGSLAFAFRFGGHNTQQFSFPSRAWKSYCLYLLIYLVHFPFLPSILLVCSFCILIKILNCPHLQNQIEKNAGAKKSTTNICYLVLLLALSGKVYELGVDVIGPSCLNILIWFNTFLMHFKTMPTKTTYQKQYFVRSSRSDNTCSNSLLLTSLDGTCTLVENMSLSRP